MCNMRCNVLVFVVLFLCNFVEIYAESQEVKNTLNKIFAASAEQSQRIPELPQIPSENNMLRVPNEKQKVDEASNTCMGSLCPKGTNQSGSSTTITDIENETILPTPGSDAAATENEITTTTEPMTILSSIQKISKSPVEHRVETNQSTGTKSSTEATMDSTELPTTVNQDEVFPRRGRSGKNVEIISNFRELPIPQFLQFYPRTEEILPSNSTIIDVALQIQSIREIEEAEQKIILDADLFVHWHDARRFVEYEEKKEAFEHLSIFEQLRQFIAFEITDRDFYEFWNPDIFIERVVKIWKPEIMSKSHLVRLIHESASVIYTMRAYIKVDCEMNFEYYPADTQNCILDIRSYKNDERKVQLRWNPGAYLVNTDTDDNFDLKLSYVANRKKRIRGLNLDEAVYDVLQLQLSMRRRMTYHLLQTYIPSGFLVIITWLSFLIPEELIEGRIGISMTTLLTLTAMFSSIRENTPVVSYVRAIDIWMAYCILTVFSTLLQFTFFVWLRNYQITKRKKKLESTIFELKRREHDSLEDGVMRQTSITDDITSMAAKAFENTAQIFNQFAFGFFVLSFVVFNISYWAWLIISSKHYSWEVDGNLNGEGDRFGFIGEPNYVNNPIWPITTDKIN